VELAGKITVITGAASGIGRAAAGRFALEGASVVVSDIDGGGAALAAAEIGDAAIPFTCDVRDADQVSALVDAAEDAFGPVDLFCANAGVSGGLDIDTPDAAWDMAFDVNVRGHVHAARRLVPGWVERGEGYFLSTASAAGLLTAIGSAPYTVTKSAAVAFAEWLAITYGKAGVRVSCLCPMGVDTPMLQEALAQRGRDRLGGQVILGSGPVLQPEAVAEALVEGLRAERFLILPHPQVDEYERQKVADREGWLEGMRRLQAHHLSELEEVV
jgi:NAD(P)-dependent dehydrogenase (short-subunit alcohol dehydrogenase family)